jgi:UDP:flavonoid glycosyltransferase YjiC (YdhE family)
MCAPSVEYERSDAPATLRFAGGYPTTKRTKIVWEVPAWWDEVVTNKRINGKKIVFVCQGTVAMDFNQLVFPAMDALRHRSDIELVIALGRPGITLPSETSIPANCHVEDFIPYDSILPHVDVFITTGGYGSFQRALKSGTPLIMAGTTEEKPESAARAEWAGVAVNLRTTYPSVDQLTDAVDEVLGNESFKMRALKIQAEIAGYDPVGVIAQCLEELAEGRE